MYKLILSYPSGDCNSECAVCGVDMEMQLPSFGCLPKFPPSDTCCRPHRWPPFWGMLRWARADRAAVTNNAACKPGVIAHLCPLLSLFLEVAVGALERQRRARATPAPSYRGPLHPRPLSVGPAEPTVCTRSALNLHAALLRHFAVIDSNNFIPHQNARALGT